MNIHAAAYTITPELIAQAEQAQQDFILLRADHPHAKASRSFRQMILNEQRHGWVWNFDTDQYERPDSEPAYTVTRAGLDAIGIPDAADNHVTMPRSMYQNLPSFFLYAGKEYRQDSDGQQFQIIRQDDGTISDVLVVAERVTSHMIWNAAENK